MPKFRKKPVVIEAAKLIGVQDDIAYFDGPVPSWLPEIKTASTLAKAHMLPEGSVYIFAGDLHIATLEGHHMASAGDWIIRGVAGELYPCRSDIFAATYEAVEEKDNA